MSPSTKNKISDLPKFGNKFMRRPDLTPSKRLHIAITALYACKKPNGDDLFLIARKNVWWHYVRNHFWSYRSAL